MPTVRLTYQPAAPGDPVVLEVEPGGVVQVDATALLQLANASPTSGTASAVAQLALNGRPVPLHGDLKVELVDTPTSTVRFGYNARPGPAALEATLGRPEVWRHFSSGAPDVRAWEPGLPVITSFKLPPVDVAAGKHDATIRAFLRAKPAALWAAVALWHEPEDNVLKTKEFTAAAWRAAQARLNQLCHEVPNCLHMPILMEYTLQPASGRNVAEFTEGFPFDAIGWDVYPTLDPADRAAKLGRIRSTSQRLGKPWAVCETGLPAMSPDGPRAQWMAAWAAELRAAGPIAVTWFITDMADPSPDYSLRSAETQAAMRAIIAA